ncbi:glycoside hydrolase family 16 protein [Streptomyces griseocarneus]|uniref:glycoside hydrolase family 16 protein n=1 Tax=Streptomyces griseocarneus TaxID=51201 RepID=UPI00167C756C|nr:glycoside hydrolase family 16 protein [Streptomyces griseocarneus]MBZ6477837.1 glycoside hydrolase family 16 protein [Streptomyces griseocarneus]GHG58109.1 hydrolase [Streptomyces griseocarneus]
MRLRLPSLTAIAAAIAVLTLAGTGCGPAGPGDSVRDDDAAPRKRAASMTRHERSDQSSRSDQSDRNDLSEWKLVWSDEFRGAAHQSPDRTKWGFERGGEPKWGNHEWQYYTDRPANASLDGRGNLAVTARHERLRGMKCGVGPCDITSARLTTKGKFARAYGRFEARIKIPKGQGLWPAFWMLGANADKVTWPANGEIDVMEALGREPGTAHGAIHGPGYVIQGLERHTALPRGGSLADGFHTYRIDWTPDTVTWYLDGKTYGNACKNQLRRGQKWVFDHPHYLLLNLAVGGDWPGPPDRSTPFPARMLVDYVRVYAPRR